MTRASLVNASIEAGRADGSAPSGFLSVAVDLGAADAPRIGGTATTTVGPIAAESGGIEPRGRETDSFTSPVVRGLQAMVNHRGGVMTMRLDPPELGAMRVQLSILGGAVSARFDADSLQAQALLRQHLPVLRHALESQGLNVERLSVTGPMSTPGQDASSRPGSDGSRPDSRPHQHDASQGESRGRREHQHRPERGSALYEFPMPRFAPRSSPTATE